MTFQDFINSKNATSMDNTGAYSFGCADDDYPEPTRPTNHASDSVSVTMTREQLKAFSMALSGVNAVFKHHLPNHADSLVIDLFCDSVASLRVGEFDSVDLTGFDFTNAFAPSCLELEGGNLHA